MLSNISIPQIKKSDSLFPDVFKVEDTDLVELAPAVGAGHERLQLQHVVLGSLELFFADYSEQRRGSYDRNVIYYIKIVFITM